MSEVHPHEWLQKLKIAGIKFDVKWFGPNIAEDGLIGSVSLDGVFRMKKTTASGMEYDTLMHEIVEAIIATYGIGDLFKEGSKEVIVNTFSIALRQFIVDNKKFISNMVLNMEEGSDGMVPDTRERPTYQQ